MQRVPSIPAGPADTNPDMVVEDGQKSSRDGLKSILSTVAILIAAPLTALLLTSFVFQSYEVDGPSMESTLQNQDRLIVWKLPRTVERVTHHKWLPPRGEIVIFIKRGLYGDVGEQKQLIKRVVGLPGDRVVVRDGFITVYNKEHPDGFNPDKEASLGPNGIATFTNGSVDLVVPEGEVFVCGDNRQNSLDSRSFGTVPASDLVGELAFRILPVNQFKSFF